MNIPANLIPTFIIVFLVVAFLMFIFQVADEKKCPNESNKTPLYKQVSTSIYIGVIGALILVPLFLMLLDIVELKKAKKELESSGFRYFKTISTHSEKKRIIDTPSYLKNICGENDYALVDSDYQNMLDSDSFYEKELYVFCENHNKHSNKHSTINPQEYDFIDVFPEYPSNEIISQHCSLESAVILNKNFETIEAEKALFDSKHDAYLYCHEDE